MCMEMLCCFLMILIKVQMDLNHANPQTAVLLE